MMKLPLEFSNLSGHIITIYEEDQVTVEVTGDINTTLKMKPQHFFWLLEQNGWKLKDSFGYKVKWEK